MLDVHPPHSPTHTWKDFFIHVGTICVGLLIAVGLEQTVELFHHRHQRHQLEEQLRTETLDNMNRALQNIDAFTALQTSMVAQYTELQAAARDHRPAQMLRQQFGPGNTYPAVTAWVVSQQEGTLGLLPVEESQFYVALYRATDRVTTSMVDEFNVRDNLYAAQLPARLFDLPNPKTGQAPTFDLSRMTPDQLRILSERLAEVYVGAANCIYRNRVLYLLDWAAWHGDTSDQDARRMRHEVAALPGDKAAMLARFPLPEEAKRLSNNEGER
jgi:hypothetical protein